MQALTHWLLNLLYTLLPFLRPRQEPPPPPPPPTIRALPLPPPLPESVPLRAEPMPDIFGSAQTGFASDGAPIEAGVQADFEIVELEEPDPDLGTPLRDDIPRIPVHLIRPGENDRKDFSLDALIELASSIGANGLAQPITIRPVPPDEQGRIFEIVAGERRYRAVSDILKWDTIPAIARDYSDREASQIMLLENVMRENLNPLEEALAYRKRMDSFGWSASECARQVSKSADRIRTRLDLLELIPDAQKLVASGNIGLGYAACMKALDHEHQYKALRFFSTVQNPSVDSFRQFCSQLLEEQEQGVLFDPTAFFLCLEKGEAWEAEERKRRRWPTNPTLPEPPKARTTAAHIEASIAVLIEQGLHEEAATVGWLYDGLLARNLTKAVKVSESPLRGVEGPPTAPVADVLEILEPMEVAA